MMRPDVVPLALFGIPGVGLIFTVAWWATNYLPGRWVAKGLSDVMPLRVVSKMCSALLRGATMVSRVDQCVKLFPGERSTAQ